MHQSNGEISGRRQGGRKPRTYLLPQLLELLRFVSASILICRSRSAVQSNTTTVSSAHSHEPVPSGCNDSIASTAGPSQPHGTYLKPFDCATLPSTRLEVFLLSDAAKLGRRRTAESLVNMVVCGNGRAMSIAGFSRLSHHRHVTFDDHVCISFQSIRQRSKDFLRS